MKNIMKTTILMVVLLASVALLAGCGLFHNEHTGGEATCGEWGVCSECGAVYIEPTGEHTGATCANEGCCTVCGSWYTEVQHTGGEATCSKWGECIVCGKEYLYPDYDNHIGGEATCAEWGRCSECGKWYIEPTGNHTEVIDSAVDATCTTTGLTEGKHCSVCNGVLVGQETVKKLPHTYDDDDDMFCNVCDGKRYSTDLYYRKNSDDTYSVYGIGSCTDTEIIIPELYEGKAVTGIYQGAFQNCTNITQITIPDSVTSIGDEAFYKCTSLTSITIGDSVTSISYRAFYGCTSLTSVTIPDSVTSIGDYAFYDCTSLTSVTIPDSVTSIGKYAFYNCTSLTSITIPDSVTSIGAEAFYNCTSLTSITIPDSVTNIDYGAFKGCSSLESITIPFVGATKDGTSNTHFGYIFGASSFIFNDDYVPASLKTVVITGGSSIGEHAFYDCRSLTSVTIGNGVTSIGDYAFYKCTSLTSVTIGNGVTSIGQDAFYDCTSLTAVYITDIKAWCEISFSNSYSNHSYSNPLYYAKNLYLNGELITELVIPDETTNISGYAFLNCPNLTSVSIPDSVTSIGDYAFYNCTNLTAVYIADIKAWCEISFSNSYSNPLYYAKNLYLNGELVTELVIPDETTNISGYAFYNCTSLTAVTIPDSVTSIGDLAFYQCYTLVEIYNKSELTITKGSTNNGYIGYYAIDIYTSESETSKLYTDENGYIFYCNDTEHYLLSYIGSEKNLILPQSCEGDNYTIYENAFANRTDITSITFPSYSEISIGSSAFSGCTGLNNIDFTYPYGSVNIGAYAFKGCTGLTHLSMDNAKSIGIGAFQDCSNLEHISIPATGDLQWESSNTHFGYIFGASTYDKNNDYVPKTLTQVFVTGRTKIETYAFYGCASLEYVTLADVVTGIGVSAFEGCTSLFGIHIPDSVTSIGSSAFEGCMSLKSINVGSYNENYESIDGNLYSKDGTTLIQYAIGKNDTRFIVPEGVTSIGQYAFLDCRNLTSITLSSDVTSIGEDAFYGCRKLVEIYNKSSLTITKGSTYNGYVGYYALNIYTPNSGESKLYTDENGYIFYISGNNNYLLGYTGEDTELSLPASCKGNDYSIYKYAFHKRSDITSVTIPDSVTSIGNYAFWDCTSLKSITIPDSVTSIGDEAFYKCTSLTSITIPDSVTSIGAEAFYNCTSLKSVTFENTDGWWVSRISTATSGTSVDVTDAAQNARYFKSTYYNYYWKRS